MKLKAIFLFLHILPFLTNAQQINIFGYLSDDASGEVLIGANIFIEELNIGTVTNEYGYYNFQTPQKEITITFSYVGYENIQKKMFPKGDTIVNLGLRSFSLSEVVVTEKRIENQISLSKISVPVKLLTDIPTIGGESDIMKSLAFFPGISTGQEGTSGLYIRGGTPDQNLILLDGIPVYNATHLGGFFSVFNPEAINNVDVYKGNFPARYGGRLSSVIDITMKEGNKEKFKGNFGVGLIASKLAIEGPIQKNKSSYIFTARSSYLGLVNSLRKKNAKEDFFNYWLYDLNFKTNFQVGKGKLFFSAYSGRDAGLIEGEYTSTTSDGGNTRRISEYNKYESNIIWGNTTLSTRYVLPISQRSFAKFLVGFTKYKFNFSTEERMEKYSPVDTLISESDNKNVSQVRDFIIQANFDFAINNENLLKYGAGLTLHRFLTNTFSRSADLDLAKIYLSTEYYAYLEDEMKLGNLTTNLGLRFSALNTEGENYYKAEPRLSLRWKLSKTLQVSSSFSTTQQYIHLLSTNNFGIPNDIWVPATKDIAPQTAVQSSLGAVFSFPRDINLSIEGYYKTMRNLIDFRVGIESDFIETANWESFVETGGEGESYGSEFLLKKQSGKLTGFMAYTLSWNYRKFEHINQGLTYPFTYDRRHDFSIVGQYKLSSKWSVSANFVYQSGTALTLPIALIPTIGGNSTEVVFGGRNTAHLPNYHRADIGAEYRRTTKKSRLLIWKFSIYNIYNRKNPSSIRLRGEAIFNENDQFLYNVNSVEQSSLFSLIPAFSLEYKF